MRIFLGVFLILLVIILGPEFFLRPGGIYVLDFVIPPFSVLPSFLSSQIQWYILDILNFLIGNELASKVFFTFILSLGVYFAYRLGSTLFEFFGQKKEDKIFFLLVSLFFIILSPFTYERMITQPGIIGGIFSFGIGITYLLSFIKKEKSSHIPLASLWFGISFSFFPHSILFIALIGLLFLSIFYHKISFKNYFFGIIIFIIPNINWLWGELFTKKVNTVGGNIESFDFANIQGFIGNSLSGLGTDITHLLLYGFWAERFHIITPDKIHPYWFIFGFIIIFIVLYGGFYFYKKEKKTFYFLSLLGIISYVLALGISSPLFGSISGLLYEKIPLYIGMREPQKWLGVTMIVFCIYFVLGAYTLSSKYVKKSLPLWLQIFMIFTLINAWNPLNLWGYQGQLFNISYPKSYFEIRDDLKGRIAPGEKILLFPWHSYMGCDWTRGKVLAVEGKKLFYPLNIVVSDNLEIVTKYSNSTSKVSKDIENYLQKKDKNILTNNKIAYIIYLKNCADPKKYTFLEKEPYFTKISDKPNITLYKITNAKITR